MAAPPAFTQARQRLLRNPPPPPPLQPSRPHLLIVPQHTGRGGCVRVQRHVRDHHHRLLRCLRLRQLGVQPGQLGVAHTAAKHHKAPLQALQALRAVLVLVGGAQEVGGKAAASAAASGVCQSDPSHLLCCLPLVAQGTCQHTPQHCCLYPVHNAWPCWPGLSLLAYLPWHAWQHTTHTPCFTRHTRLNPCRLSRRPTIHMGSHPAPQLTSLGFLVSRVWRAARWRGWSSGQPGTTEATASSMAWHESSPCLCSLLSAHPFN